MATSPGNRRRARRTAAANESGARTVALGSVLLIAGVHFAAFVDRSAPAVFAAALAEAFDLTDGDVGMLQGPAFALTYAAAMLAAGHWGRRVEPFRLMALSVAVWTAGGIAFALAPDYPTLAASRMLLGIGQAAFAPAALIVLGSASVGVGRARAVSIFTTGSATGRSGGLFLGGALLMVATGASLWGLAPWRMASLALVLPNLALVAALLVLARRGGLAEVEPRAGLGQALGWLAREGRGALGLFFAGAGCVLSVQAAGAWMPSILHRSFDLPPGRAAMLVGAVVLAAAPAGHLAAGWILGRERGRGPAPLLVAGLALSTVAAAGLWAATTLAATVAALAALVAASGMAAAASLIGLQPLAPERYRGPVNTLYLAGVSAIGVGLGPWLTGALSDLNGARAAGLIASLAGVVVAVAAAVIPVAVLHGRRWTPETD